jgi:tetratricopeptide (TPR) repeat protein
MTSASSLPDPGTPGPSPEQRRAAAGQFERANQVVATGNFDYGIHLLFDCCVLDPANLLYRQALRRAEKAKYRNNLRGSWLAWLWSWRLRARMKAARSAARQLKVLELGERILMRNPWDVGAQADMAHAAESLGLIDLAIWNLEQARHKQPGDAPLNRSLARLYERRGNFTQAMALWHLVRKANPDDVEAQQKLTELAVHETIHRGNLEEVLASGNAAPGAAAAGAGALSTTPFPEPAGKLGDLVEREAAGLRSRLQGDPTSAALYLQLARLYRKAGRLETAHATLAEGLGATGNAFELVAEQADLEIEPFRRNLAITEDKLAANPDDAELRRIRLHLRKEINTRELDLHRLRADRFPTELGHRYEVGVRLLRAGQLDEAIREFQASRGDARFRWQSALYLGYCFKARNNWRLAQRNFEEALELLPPGETANRKDLLYELARGHADAGDLAKAIDIAHELAHLDFAYRDISALMDEWQAEAS